MNTTQVIFFAHGSSDPVWQQAVVNLQCEMARAQQHSVEIAYMERAEPSLETVMQRSYADGVRTFLIVPLFLAPGGHMSHDVTPLVERLKKTYQDAKISLQPTLLEHAVVRLALIENIKSVLPG